MMVAYHGSHRPGRTPQRSEVGEYGPGFYFAAERADAETYGPYVYVAELDLQRPFMGGAELSPDMDRIRRAYRIDDEYLDESEPMWPQIMGYIKTLIETGMASHDSLQRVIEKLGYDSIVVPGGVIEQEGIVGDFVVVFDPEQIQSWKVVNPGGDGGDDAVDNPSSPNQWFYYGVRGRIERVLVEALDGELLADSRNQRDAHEYFYVSGYTPSGRYWHNISPKRVAEAATKFAQEYGEVMVVYLGVTRTHYVAFDGDGNFEHRGKAAKWGWQDQAKLDREQGYDPHAIPGPSLPRTPTPEETMQQPRLPRPRPEEPKPSPYQLLQVQRQDADEPEDNPNIDSLRDNPPWTNRIMREHWDALLAVGQPMPTRYAKELGCGSYGCVYQTEDPGVVFKLSSDSTEGEFIQLAEPWGWPEGIVQYHGIIELDTTHRRRPVFALWREAAQTVGLYNVQPLTRYENDAQEQFALWLASFSRHAGFIRARLRQRPHMWEQSKQYRRRAWDHVGIEDARLNRTMFLVGAGTTRLDRVAGPEGIAMRWRACEIAAELMEHTYLSDRVGGALRFYMEHGVLLADVHANNVGQVRRVYDDEGSAYTPWVITDPGHAVVLDVEGLE